MTTKTLETTGLDYCPRCEGSGQVPSLSGWTDVDCLCATLDANDRVILRGRTDTLQAWEAQLPRCTEIGQEFLAQQIEHLRSTMVHLVAGCEGRCRGNSSNADRCVL